MKQLNVPLGERSYPIYIGGGLLNRSDALLPHVRGREVLVVTNDTVAPLYLDRLCRLFARHRLDTLVLPDGERYKTLDTLTLIYDRLLELGHSRGTTLVALGGGVIGDMTGFAAATYQRGVSFIQVPTTLLAQVDSSVGGKTGVNHALGKNMIGAFHQPAAVIADVDTLATLPEREYRAGVAEVVKYGLIADAGFYRWLWRHTGAINDRDTGVLTDIVEHSCRAKADVVARDEREADIRAILNLGHTFGHAIEALENYQGLLHGEAVAVGMLMAADLSRRLGWLEPRQVADLRALLEALHLPVTVPPGLAAQGLLEAMARDKKVHEGVVRLVLLHDLGEAVVTGDYPEALLRATLEAFCSPVP